MKFARYGYYEAGGVDTARGFRLSGAAVDELRLHMEAEGGTAADMTKRLRDKVSAHLPNAAKETRKWWLRVLGQLAIDASPGARTKIQRIKANVDKAAVI